MPRWEDLINTEQAARILGCGRANVARLCRTGKLKAKDIGHGAGDTFTKWVIDRRDVLRLQAERERNGAR